MNPTWTKPLPRLARLAEGYAAKWRAEHECAEPPQSEAPTDEAFARTFAGCGWPPHPRMYPMIREALAAWEVSA